VTFLKIIIVGLSYFSKKLTCELKKIDKKNHYINIDVNKNLFNRMKYFLILPFADIVYSIGGNICPRKVFSVAMRLKKRIIMHWVGTDVLVAGNDYKNKTFEPRFINGITHFCEVSWIQKELKLIGIKADIVQFIILNNENSTIEKFPEKFSILTYMPKGREKFYGIDWIIRLANDFPDVNIKVTGMSKYNLKLPENIKLHGYVKNMKDFYNSSVVYLRLTEHDGLPFSVLEALSSARYVGYTYKLHGCNFIDNYPALKKLVLELKKKFDNKKLGLNNAGLDFVRKNFKKEIILKKLMSKFIK
jgi:hypothetical protein